MAITQASKAEATNKAASQSMEISPITEAHQTFYTIEDDCTQSRLPLHASSSRTSADSWSNGLSFDTDGSKNCHIRGCKPVGSSKQKRRLSSCGIFAWVLESVGMRWGHTSSKHSVGLEDLRAAPCERVQDLSKSQFIADADTIDSKPFSTIARYR